MNDTSIKTLHISVRSALNGTASDGSGGANTYVELLKQFRDGREDVITKLLVAVAGAVDILAAQPRRHAMLCSVIFDMHWHNDSQFVSAYIDLLFALVSANGVFLVPVVRALVRGVLPASTDDEAQFDHSQWDQPAIWALQGRNDFNNSKSVSELRFASCITSVKAILSLVPTGTGEVTRAFTYAFPHRRNNGWIIRAYTRRLLLLAEYVPTLRASILSCIFDQMIGMDVEIRIDDDMETTDAVMASRQMAEKLDGVMEELIRYIDNYCFADSTTLGESVPSQYQGQNMALVRARRERMFALLLTTFERSILHTYQSKFAQFVLFYFCRLGLHTADMFVGRLINHCRSTSLPLITRQACAAYVGSYLARGAYLAVSTVRSALFYVMQWIHQHVDEQAQAKRKGNASHDTFHDRTFISVCQSAFYVVCFRAAEFMQDETGISFLRSFRWGRVVTCPADPLGHCLDSVAQEFVRIGLDLELLAYRHVKCSKAYQKLSHGSMQSPSTDPFSCFFPFDPFLLKRSSRFISGAGLYRCWERPEPRRRNSADSIASSMGSTDHPHRIMSSHSDSSGSDSDDDVCGNFNLRTTPYIARPCGTGKTANVISDQRIMSRIRGLSFDEDSYADMALVARKQCSSPQRQHTRDDFKDVTDTAKDYGSVPSWSLFRDMMTKVKPHKKLYT